METRLLRPVLDIRLCLDYRSYVYAYVYALWAFSNYSQPL
jgi:hypothetical protein